IGLSDLHMICLDSLLRGANAVDRAETEAMARFDGIVEHVRRSLDRRLLQRRRLPVFETRRTSSLGGDTYPL
ncbi:hypothetical protein, partial [uncultured Roseibium sp.]|uniref:hypothetical protein n=1 Tax=uncultured Roseibium sp. TaxID=1936171 RepID=UPI00321736E0